MSAPGVAAGNTLDAEPGSLEQSMFLQGLYRIMGTAGCKPATRPKSRGDHPLIKTDERYQGKAEDTQDLAHFTSLINFCKATPIFAFTVL
jgi:hypothetical protein